jgi:Na+/proline symporter
LVLALGFWAARWSQPQTLSNLDEWGLGRRRPYIALQLLGMEAVFKTIGTNGAWSLWVAFGLLGILTYNAGLRAPALFAIVKDVLVLWVVFAALIIIATRTPSPASTLSVPRPRIDNCLNSGEVSVRALSSTRPAIRAPPTPYTASQPAASHRGPCSAVLREEAHPDDL